MCYNQTPLKLVDKFTYLGNSVSSTEKDSDTRLTKAWTAINRLPIIWKSDLTDKMKRTFFQAAVVSILLYGCTTWTLTKRLEKKLDGNYTRMLRAILNKSWWQHSTRHQLYGHLPPITKTIQVRRTRHAGHCWRSRYELISDVLLQVREDLGIMAIKGYLTFRCYHYGLKWTRSNGNEGLLHISQSYRPTASLWDGLMSYPRSSLTVVSLTPLQKCSRCILLPQTTVLVLFREISSWTIVIITERKLTCRYRDNR